MKESWTMRLMILENQRLRNSIRLDGGQVAIGSDATCQIHLPDPRLGKHQANIAQDDSGEWWLEVVDHAVPTCINRAVQKSRAKLRHADEIECGEFSIRFYEESERTREEMQHDRMIAVSRTHGDSLPLDTIILKEDEDMVVSRIHLEEHLQLAIRLAQCDHVGDTLPLVLRAANRQFEARRAWIGIRKVAKADLDWMLGENAAGKPVPRPPFSAVTESRCIKLGHHICTPQVPHDGCGSAMAVPISGRHFSLGVLYVENDAGDPRYDERSLIALKALACAAATPIDALLSKSLAVRKAAATTEITLARSAQDALTPKTLPKWEDLQIAAYRHMGRESCTDFYDIVQLRDKSAALLVAKLQGPTAAIPFMLGELRAAFRAAVLYGEAPHLFARALNWMLFDGRHDTGIHIAVARAFPKNGKVTYCLAGPGVMAAQVHADGSAERVENGSAAPVGSTRSPGYEAASIVMNEGDSLILATNGVETARNEAGEVFGAHGLCEAICDGIGDTPGHVLNEFASDLTEFVEKGSNPEDISVIVLRRD